MGDGRNTRAPTFDQVEDPLQGLMSLARKAVEKLPDMLREAYLLLAAGLFALGLALAMGLGLAAEEEPELAVAVAGVGLAMLVGVGLVYRHYSFLGSMADQYRFVQRLEGLEPVAMIPQGEDPLQRYLAHLKGEGITLVSPTEETDESFALYRQKISRSGFSPFGGSGGPVVALAMLSTPPDSEDLKAYWQKSVALQSRLGSPLLAVLLWQGRLAEPLLEEFEALGRPQSGGAQCELQLAVEMADGSYDVATRLRRVLKWD